MPCVVEPKLEPRCQHLETAILLHRLICKVLVEPVKLSPVHSASKKDIKSIGNNLKMEKESSSAAGKPEAAQSQMHSSFSSLM